MPIRSLAEEVEGVVVSLRRLGTKRTRDGMARYAIPSDNAFGVSVGTLRQLAKRLGRKHELAAALWDTGWYEARMLAAFVDEPACVTPVQMDRWCRDFDNWAICDTVCFKLFDSVPYAFEKVRKWAVSKDEFTRRAGFALLACMSPEDERAAEGEFVKCLPLIEKMATDERNFVKKAVNWALRAVGGRSRALHAACTAMAQRLDVQGAKLAAQQTAKNLELTRSTRFVNVLEVGVSRNTFNEGPDERGWEIGLVLPLFDWGDARVAEAEAIYMQSLHRAAETAVNARSEVREAYGAYRTAWDMARHHREEIVPLRQKILDENLLRYNGMLIGVFELLADARLQIASVQASIDALRDFWLAEADLDMALIGKPALAAMSAAPAAAQAAGGDAH